MSNFFLDSNFIFLVFFCIVVISYYLAGGLYGRILTKIVSTVRPQWGLYTRPR